MEAVLPGAPSQPSVTINDDRGTVVGVLTHPLYYAGPAVCSDAELIEPDSDLYSVKLDYRVATDRTGVHPAIQESSFQIEVYGKPAIRFEYDREKTAVPSAHIHVHGTGGLLSPGLMRNGRSGRGRKGDWQDLHLPVGGHRFRPSMEDFLFFVTKECGFRSRADAVATLRESREKWLDTQCRAAVRDAPEEAAAALRQLGYRVELMNGASHRITNRRSEW